MANNNQLKIDSLVAAIRREATQLTDYEEAFCTTVVSSQQQSLTEIDRSINAAIQAMEDLVKPRLSARPSPRNFFKKLCTKVGLTILDRLERRRCKAELTLLETIQYLRASQQQLRAEFNDFQSVTDQALVRQFNHLQRQIDRTSSCVNLNPDLEKLLETFYCQFESEYRGSSESVRHRLRPYHDRLLNSDYPLEIVDLGCGRGEWLSLVNQLGHKAKGIDCNPEFVNLCKQQNLAVELGDATVWLHSQADSSLDIISAFHVIEHLSFTTLADWLQQIYRVLKPQGWLLLETPNISQFHVGLVDFYRDPTHIHKVHPQTIKTLLQCLRFTDIEIGYVDANGDEVQWLPTEEVTLRDPGQYGALPADMGIIARKKIGL
ncbi:class I SAM-dependent methyltransferase [Synechococcus elongatus]|uniref:class I SAM-dependent methyltransferase n=1 Tax=Synechococcus elongatus TaxID=32046 RepID=UPI000F7DE916|nr:class I SAM-dependent methyltransferase [Synechococcus elongatus]